MKHSTSCNLKRCDGWIRLLYMLVIFVCYSISKMIVAAIALFQIIMFVFTRNINPSLRTFGQNLSSYHYQVIRFLTFNSEKRPFPFSDWPTGLLDLAEEDEPSANDSGCCGNTCACHCQTDATSENHHTAEAEPTTKPTAKPETPPENQVLEATVVDEPCKTAQAETEKTATEQRTSNADPIETNTADDKSKDVKDKAPTEDKPLPAEGEKLKKDAAAP